MERIRNVTEILAMECPKDKIGLVVVKDVYGGVTLFNDKVKLKVSVQRLVPPVGNRAMVVEYE